MFGIGLVELAILAVLVVLVVVLLVLAPRRADRSVQVRREWRLVQLTRVAGVVAGLALASALPDGTGLGPAVLGLAVLVAVVLGETVVRPRRPGGARTASLSPRRVRDYAPRHLSRCVLAGTVGTVVLTAASIAFLGEDPRNGRVVLRGCVNDWPGLVETDPAAATPLLLLVLAAVLVVATLAARQVVRRPRGMGATDGDDDALRRRSLAVVTAALGLAASMTGITVVTGLLSATEQSTGGRGCIVDGAWTGPVQAVGGILALFYLGLFLYCVLELLLGRAVALRHARTRETATR